MADALSRPKLILLCASAFGALGTSQAFAQQPGEISAPALPPALETAIAQSHEALRKILNGDPSGTQPYLQIATTSLWATRSVHLERVEPKR